jgi:hypothetical protein
LVSGVSVRRRARLLGPALLLIPARLAIASTFGAAIIARLPVAAGVTRLILTLATVRRLGLLALTRVLATGTLATRRATIRTAFAAFSVGLRLCGLIRGCRAAIDVSVAWRARGALGFGLIVSRPIASGPIVSGPVVSRLIAARTIAARPVTTARTSATLTAARAALVAATA